MDTSRTRPTAHYLSCRLVGELVDASALLAAVWDGSLTDLDLVETTLAAKPYLSSSQLPVVTEITGYSPVRYENGENGGER
jgi:hypothetical protein